MFLRLPKVVSDDLISSSMVSIISFENLKNLLKQDYVYCLESRLRNLFRMLRFYLLN